MSPEEQAEALYREVLGVCGRFQLEFDLADDTMAGVLTRAVFDLNCGSITFDASFDFRGGCDDVELE